LSPVRILIAEDEPITAEDISDILTHLGYIVTAVVSTGADAVFQGEHTTPDLAMMDINLKGDMDGVTAARILRERFDIPVIYLTAHADPETLSRAKLAEPLGYIVKPFQETELRASIEIALHKRKIDREARERAERLSATVQAIGEGVIGIDASGRVTLVNAAAEAWTGSTESEARGKDAREVLQIVDARTRRPASGFIQEALGKGHLAALEENSVLIARDGTERPVGGSAAPVRNHEGSISGAVIVFGDRPDYRGISKTAGSGAESSGAAPAPSLPDIVVESGVMKQLLNFARRVAQSEASTILIEGESGTGKDIVAKFVHYNSARRARPFMAINCAAIPETLLESELFGYEKGAFTDARAQKKGILELADGGTVFLDEIGDMPLGLQAKLLRVLEDQCFRRLGGVKDIHVDLRVITATIRDLRDAIQQGRFRLDLYYRLNMIQMVIPPLRQRTEDILPLAHHFLRSSKGKFKRDIKGLSPEASAALLRHPWPGNVRELRNTIERVMILEDTDFVQVANLGLRPEDYISGPPEHSLDAPPIHEGMSLGEAEKAMLVDALNKTNWNQSRAARLLKITRDTLRYKMKKFNLQR
jgi:PAS domain S-box-containing protein